VCSTCRFHCRFQDGDVNFQLVGHNQKPLQGKIKQVHLQQVAINLVPRASYNRETIYINLMHLADVFIQSNLGCRCTSSKTKVQTGFYQQMHPQGIKPMTLPLLTPCTTASVALLFLIYS